MTANFTNGHYFSRFKAYFSPFHLVVVSDDEMKN
jgi:hypothetical protein